MNFFLLYVGFILLFWLMSEKTKKHSSTTGDFQKGSEPSDAPSGDFEDFSGSPPESNFR